MAAGFTRREVIKGAGALGALALGGGLLLDRLTDDATIPLGDQPAGLPERQHAWVEALETDTHGNPRLPRFGRLLMFDLVGRPTLDGARRIEAALRTLERAFPWNTSGLLFALGWGPSYFTRSLGVDSPIPPPASLSSFEVPELEDYVACLHLACDSEQRLRDVQEALAGTATLEEAEGPLDLSPVLRLRQSRTGFAGDGLPAARCDQSLAGIPSGCPISSTAPLFMGFKSGFRSNQATEDDVTLGSGPLAGATTMHVSRLSLGLDSWYGGLTEDQRARRMFAPQLSARQVGEFTDEAPTFAEDIEKSARQLGVVGHAQAAAQARKGGRPLIIRRDFNSTDNHEATLHFVALQRQIDDFIATRRAMNASEMIGLGSGVQTLVNNGIKEWFRVTHRANFLVPPRSQRALPLL